MLCDVFMKALKIILGTVYIVLLLLLLLFAKGCCGNMTTAEVPIDTNNVVRQAELIGQNGALKVTLMWNFDGDIDLHVMQPNGNEIYYDKNEDVSTGGYLDVDDVNGGNGSAENIYWKNPLKGKYKVSLVYYQPSRANNKAGTGICTVVIFEEGKESRKYEVHMSKVKEKKYITSILLK